MIRFHYETDFTLPDEALIASWISGVIQSEGFKEGDINYIFCDDDYVHRLNVEFLDHDTLTDIISFDYSVGKILHGDVFISVDRAKDNAHKYDVDTINEVHRLIVHGVLHYCGYKDKSEEDARMMRERENFYLDRQAANS